MPVCDSMLIFLSTLPPVPRLLADFGVVVVVVLVVVIDVVVFVVVAAAALWLVSFLFLFLIFFPFVSFVWLSYAAVSATLCLFCICHRHF